MLTGSYKGFRNFRLGTKFWIQDSPGEYRNRLPMQKQNICEEAFANATSALRPGARFPENVFVTSWQNFLFMESDALFSGNFIWGIKEFLRIERSASACLVNLDRRESGSERSAICLDSRTTNDFYQEQLRSEIVDDAWLYNVERYVCASNGGSWCVYAERTEDIAVIALRDIAASTQFEFALSYFGADSLAYSLQYRHPFTKTTLQWRTDLVKNYKPSKGRNSL